MANKKQPQKDPTLDEIIRTGKEDTRLDRLKTYMFESDLTLEKRPVRVSFVLAHGRGTDKISETPRTLGELRQNFKDNLSFEAPDGNHDRTQIVVRYQDPK